MQLHTTLNKIYAHRPCAAGWKKLLNGLGKITADDEPLLFETILEINCFADALWCTRAAPEYDNEWRLYAVWCARQVQHLMLDLRSLAALDVTERYAHGLASGDELAAAWAAARAAAEDAAEDAAGDAAWAAARAAEEDAAGEVALAAARAAARAAAEDAAVDAQEARFRLVTKGG